MVQNQGSSVYSIDAACRGGIDPSDHRYRNRSLTHPGVRNLHRAGPKAPGGRGRIGRAYQGSLPDAAVSPRRSRRSRRRRCPLFHSCVPGRRQLAPLRKTPAGFHLSPTQADAARAPGAPEPTAFPSREDWIVPGPACVKCTTVAHTSSCSIRRDGPRGSARRADTDAPWAWAERASTRQTRASLVAPPPRLPPAAERCGRRAATVGLGLALDLPPSSPGRLSPASVLSFMVPRAADTQRTASSLETCSQTPSVARMRNRSAGVSSSAVTTGSAVM